MMCREVWGSDGKSPSLRRCLAETMTKKLFAKFATTLERSFGKYLLVVRRVISEFIHDGDSLFSCGLRTPEREV